MKNSIEEDIKILEGIIKGDEDCINAIYSQMKVKNDNDEDIQYHKKEIQSIKNIVDNYLKEKARADKLEKEYSAMLTESDENECDYKRVLKENEEKNKIKEQKECTFREYGAEEGLWYCSNCHDEWLFYEGTPEENNLKYCPHCGAKVIKYESYIETEIEIANKMAKDYLKESEE